MGCDLASPKPNALFFVGSAYEHPNRSHGKEDLGQVGSTRGVGSVSELPGTLPYTGPVRNSHHLEVE